MRLANKVALITGGNSGMGRATARLFAQEGAKVAITGRNEQRGREATEEIGRDGGQAIFVKSDVRFSQDCQRADSVPGDRFASRHRQYAFTAPGAEFRGTLSADR